MWFICQVENKRGYVRWHVKRASSFYACVRFYLTRGVYIYKIISLSNYMLQKTSSLKKNGTKYWEYFFEKLHSLLASGETLLTALNVLQEDKSISQTFVAKALINLKNGLFIGPLWYDESVPLNKGQMYLLQCAEQGGFFTQGVKQIKESLHFQIKVKKQICRGLIYPACVLCTMFCLMCVLSLFWLRNMETIFKEQAIEPGVLGKFIFSANHYFIPIFCSFLLIGCFVFIFLKLRNISLLDKVERFIEKRCRWLQYSIFSMNLSAFLENNFSVVEGVKIALENFVDKSTQNNVLLGLNNGQSLSAALSFMPKDFYMTLQNGEISGEVVETLKQLSQMYYQRYEEKLIQWTKYTEPLCLISIAVFVFLLVIEIFSQLLQLFESINLE